MKLLLPALFLALAGPLAAQAPPSQVTIPLTEYENLKRGQERPSLTVVDTLGFSGSFKARDLAVSFTGHSSNRMPTEAVLSASDGVVLYGCAGEGIVSRGDGNGFALTPLSADYAASRAPSSPAAPAEHKAAPKREAEVQAYQGLPAKVQLPHGVERTFFSREMLGTGTPRTAKVLMVSRSLVAAFQLLLVLIAVVLVFRTRAEIAQGFRARLAEARGEQAAAAAQNL